MGLLLVEQGRLNRLYGVARDPVRMQHPLFVCASVFVYILKPESTLVFDPRPPVRRPVIKMLDSDLLLAAYVRLADRPVVQGGEPVVGFVTRLETIEGGPAEPGLPLDYLERYENRVW